PSKAVEQKKSVGGKQKNVSEKGKTAGKSKALTPAKSVDSTPKTKKKIAVNQTAKRKKEQIVSATSVKKSKPKKEQAATQITDQKVMTAGKKAVVTAPNQKPKKKAENKTETVVSKTIAKSAKKAKATEGKVK